VLGPAIAAGGDPSHAYLFHGPGGAGKRTVARALAAELLAEGSADGDGARRRVLSGAHTDLTWVAPSGAHEILVSDIDGPVVAAAARTPFESTRRVFVLERVDELGDEAANRMLKTLEEPAPFVHLILLTDRLAEVLPTIRSRCQLVRFDAPAEADAAARLAGEDGAVLRTGAELFARSALRGEVSGRRPWTELLAGVRAQGELLRMQLEQRVVDELELYPRKERKRIETEWAERIRRARRRAETAALDLALQMVSLWYRDLACIAWGAGELVHHVDRAAQLQADPGHDPGQLRAAVELVEETRQRFQLNVSEELACEALAYRLESSLA
jgi:DNA polymerase-3 subunit delta'